MAKVEVNLPDRIDGEIDRLVHEGEFLNRERAMEELLSRGISAYDVEEEDLPETGEDLFAQTQTDDKDPAMRDDEGGEGPTF